MFWINCKLWQTGCKTCQESIAIVQYVQNKSLNKELWSMFPRKGLIFVMLNKANLQDWAVLTMWLEKVSWLSIITPRFLAVFERVMAGVLNWMVKLWWNDGFAGTTNSYVMAKLSWRWWSFIQQEMSVRHAEMWAAIVRSSGWMRGRVECHQHSSDMKSHVSDDRT